MMHSSPISNISQQYIAESKFQAKSAVFKSSLLYIPSHGRVIAVCRELTQPNGTESKYTQVKTQQMVLESYAE